ncbi:MAG: hypothetical protein FJ301_10060 [Planctomycetes bacterium]|nr:hypothetical protein [Planctomycetota bacterium]
MAQDVRSRRALNGARLLALLLAACGGAVDVAPTPRAVDLAAIPGERLADAVLQECHAPLRGAMTRLGATVTLPDGRVVNAFVELPERVRAQSSAGLFVLRGDEVWRLDGDAAATPAQQDEVRALRTLLDAASFGPLHRAQRCARVDATTFDVVEADGATTRVTLRPGTLLPSRLVGAHGAVEVHDHLRTQTTWIARELTIAGLGRCRVRFDSGAIDWSADAFARPDDGPTAPARPRTTAPGSGGEAQSPTPVLAPGKPTRWACVRDPGDWAARAAAYAPLHAELTRQGQLIAGFPLLFEADGSRWLAAPFRRREGGPAFAAPTGWDLRDATGDELVCYPDGGDVAARMATGERMLRAALLAQGRTAAGPVTAQAFAHLEDGAADDSKLATAKVRMAVRVE